ncbi:BnaC03g69000D [Brassica napus]|uniref:BnaC03g69000D protein n=1 Tax=Brassica napus TaxID=3708 RepID=A0A078IMP0_BRANA|nr:BnaC03g69000D [Brassica napus]
MLVGFRTSDILVLDVWQQRWMIGYGDKEGIEDAIAGNRRFQYEDEVRKNPLNYDSWINYALYEEIKTEDVERTRDIFKNYIEIEIELQLGNIDRCRKLYELYLEWFPENCYAWNKYAELERYLAETELARTIFELAISQPTLDMP